MTALTDPQMQFIIRFLHNKVGADVITSPAVSLREGELAEFPFPGRDLADLDVPLHLRAHPSPDGWTIDLEMSFAGSEGEPIPVTIWDGQTCVLAQPLPDGEMDLFFLTAGLVDAAGMPLRRNPAEVDLVDSFLPPPGNVPGDGAAAP